MKLQDQNILFFTRTMALGGTENVILQLCEVFKPLVHNIVVCSSGGINEGKLSAMGIRHYTIPDIEKKSIHNLLTIPAEVKKIIRQENITVIHTHHRMAAFYVRLIGLHRRYFINTSHNTFNNKRGLTRYAYNKASLIACGEMVKNNLENFFGLRDVKVIHNAVKPFSGEIVFDDKLKTAKDNGMVLIGNIGRLSEQKGMEYFIQAVPLVISKHPEALFFIIGSGEEEKKLKSMAEGLPIVFLGYRNDIQNLMSQLDLVVLSSLWEGLPLTPIEAFSVGKTIVATGVDGTLEIVKNKENGLLAKERDFRDLAEKINWMIEHPEEKRLMEEEAKEMFKEKFSFDILAKSYIDYYRSL